MAFSEEQLMLLESLTYMKSACNKAGVAYDTDSVSDLINSFYRTDKNGNTPIDKLKGEMGVDTGEDWKKVIEAIKKDEELMSLELVASKESSGIFCYHKPADETKIDEKTGEKEKEETIVIFQGTRDGTEWKDNAEGLNQADTQKQKEALDFIESLPYTNITTVGHSKGGNKAMYTALLSDKVVQCITMDGQGFSEEFYEKYYAEVAKNAGKIKAYAVEDDYVNILMFYPPGVEIEFCKNSKDKHGMGNHSVLAFYHFDENGYHIITDYKQNKGMEYFHEFVNFISNEMYDSEKDKVKKYLGLILALAMDENFVYEHNGTEYSKDNLIDFIMTDKDTLAIIVAYLVKYIKVYALTPEEVRALMEAFGFNRENADLADNIIALVSDEVWDEKGFLDNDIAIRALIGFFSLKTGDDYSYIYNKAQEEYKSIGDVDKEHATDEVKVKAGYKKDFSVAMKSVFDGVTYGVDSNMMRGVAGWSAYSDEDWYDSLFIAFMVKGINSYINNIKYLDATCRNRVLKIWQDVASLDTACANKLRMISDAVSVQQQLIQDMADNIVLNAVN